MTVGAVLRADTPGGPRAVQGATAVAPHAMAYSTRANFARDALINGAAGLVVVAHERPVAAMAFSVVDGRIAELDIIADPESLRRLDLSAIASPAGA